MPAAWAFVPPVSGVSLRLILERKTKKEPREGVEKEPREGVERDKKSAHAPAPGTGGTNADATAFVVRQRERTQVGQLRHALSPVPRYQVIRMQCCGSTPPPG